MNRRVLLAILLLGAAAPSEAPAQLEPIGVPKGQLRVGLGGTFENYDRRFRNGRVEDIAADFSRDSLGSNFFPSLAVGDTLVGLIAGIPNYHLSLGRTDAHAEVNVGTGALTFALGLTRRLTISLYAPIVRSRVQPHVQLDSLNGDVGLNPNAASTFLTNFQAAIDTLDLRITNGAYAGAQLATAIATRDRAVVLKAQFAQLTGFTPFLPTISSPAGQAIQQRVAGLQDTLTTLLTVPAAVFSDAAPLPAARLDPSALDNFILSAGGPIQGFPLQEALISRLGDIRLGASYTLIDRWDRGDASGGVRIVGRGAVTLPTGLPDRSTNFFDTGTGNGRVDVAGGIVADIGHGAWGARLTGDYTLTMPGIRTKRLSPPSQPVAPLSSLTNLRVNAGNTLAISVLPFFRLEPSLALRVGVTYWRRSTDRVTYATPADSIPGLDPQLFGLESSAGATILSGGISYASQAARGCREQRCGLPIEATWSYEGVIAATGGRVPQSRTMRMEFRFYAWMWGRPGR
ncbi:MAG: hypothetical protein ABJD11_18600 [Gemmatimonadota bacterium]